MSSTASLPVRRQPATERTKFIVYALWLAGFSASQIARYVGGRRSVALGLAQRSPWGNRAAMSLAERQQALDELRAIRCDNAGVPIDGGALGAAAFVARPLVGRQILRT